MASVFGKDTSCTTGIRAGRFVTGLRLVAEAAYRRITTPRGMLRGSEDDQSYGIDITELIGQASSKAVVAALPGRIANKLAKDERIESTEVDVAEVTSGIERSYAITIRCVTAEGPFTLQLAASDVSVELLGIEEAA